MINESRRFLDSNLMTAKTFDNNYLDIIYHSKDYTKKFKGKKLNTSYITRKYGLKGADVLLLYYCYENSL